MDDPVLLAATNNVLQSEAVLAALGSSGSFTEDFWSNGHSFEIPYANGATIGGGDKVADHLGAIERLSATRPPNAPTYVMDSWAALDLTPLGYRLRISDEWHIRTEPVEPHPDSRVEPITTAGDLAAFEAASVVGFGGAAPAEAGHTYQPSLLDDDRFQFFGVRVDGELAAGVMLFRDPRCTGVYTFFTLPQHRGQGLGTALLQHALGHAPDLPFATNPSEMSRRIFERLGFRAVGSRRIWAR